MNKNENQVQEVQGTKDARKQGVTAKTLKAFTEQGKKIIEEKLLNEKDTITFEELLLKVKNGWIRKNFN